MKITNRQLIVAVIFFAVFAGNLVRYSQRAPRRHYSDWRVYYATGERFIDKEDIYSRPNEEITPFMYSPTFAMFFSLLSLIPKHPASLVFFTLNFLSVVGIFLISRKLIGAQQLTSKQFWILLFFPILFTSRFILLVWDSGQVNLIMLFLVMMSLYLLSRKKVLLSSAFMALSILVKYMPVVFLPYFFIKKQFKLVAGVLLFILLFSILPAFYVGVEQEINYLKGWLPFISDAALDLSSWVDYKNQSIYSMVLRYTMDLSAYVYSYSHTFLNLSFYQGLGIALVFSFVIYLLILVPRKNAGDQSLIDYAMLLLCMALFNPNAWMTNFVVFFHVYIFLIHYVMKSPRKEAFTIAAMVTAFALSSWASESVVGNDLENLFEELSSVTIAALVLIAALLRLKFRRLSSPAPG